MVYTASLSAVIGLLILLVARPIDGCVPSPGSTGCQCDAGTSCSAIWFSCRQDGAATINNIGLAFTYGQPQRTDPGYRWYIANGNSGPTYPGQTSGFVDGAGNAIAIPYLPYSTNSVGGSGSPTSPQWLTSGINPLTASNPVTTGGWACTVDSLLQRSLNGGIGPTQPKCQYGTAPPVGVSTASPCNPCCQPVKLFDGFSDLQSSGWQLAAAAAITSTGSVAEFPSAASARSQPQGAGIGTVATSSGLADGELRQIVTVTGNGVDMKCFISLFDPCNICPTPQPTPPTPGCCPSGQQLINGECCPTSSIVTSTTPPTCCPASGGPWVVCPSATTPNCQAATSPDSPARSCCPASRWIATSQTCCPATDPSLPVFGQPNTYMCCPTAQQVNGQCCPSGNTIVDGTCCPDSRIVDSHCCLTCNVPNVQCSSISPAPTSATYDWISGQFCCAVTQINNGACCPTCVSSPVTVNTDLRNSGDCGRSPGGVNCCPSAQRVSHITTANTYCCPAGTTYDASYKVVDRSEGSSSARCCPGDRIKCGTGAQASIPYICCSDATDICVSTSNPCCAQSEARLYATGQVGCCGATASRCNGDFDTLMTDCTYLGEGNCCPTGALTRDANDADPTCCYGQAGGPTWYQTPVCSACNRGAGTPENDCCPAANVATNPPTNPPTAATAVACCPQAMTNYGPPTRSLSGSTALDYCCPTAQVTAGNTATGTSGINFCCPGSGYTIIGTGNTFGSGDGVQCCPTGRVPNQPGTSTPVLDVNVCCPSNPPTGATWYYIGGSCCLSTNAVQDSGNVWRCCPYASPLWLNGACCRSDDALTSGGNPVYCCPNGNTGTVCSFPPPTTTSPPACYVYNGAPGGWIVLNPANNNPWLDCCPANRLSYTGTASSSTTYYCCPSTSFRYTSNDECCPPTRVPDQWDGVARFSPQTSYGSGRQPLRQPNDDYCCPSTVIGGVTYTQTYLTQGTFNADCCPQINVNKDAHTNALVVTDDSMCCNNPGYLVDQKATALTSSNWLYCCPSNQLLPPTPGQAGTTYYCCENALRGGEIWFTSTPASGTPTSGCCLLANIISNPSATTEKVCCPATGYAWTDTAPSSRWPSSVDHCCDARFALPTTVSGLANSYCCPTNTPGAPATGVPGSAGSPSSNPWQVFRSIPRSFVNNGTSWSSIAYQCCPVENKQINLIVDNTGASVSICCPGPNLVYMIGNSNHQPGCCPNDTIKYDVGHEGDLRYATCCPANANTSAISETSGQLICCPNGKFNGIDICCDAPSSPLNPVPTINDPCCNVSERLSVSGLPWNRAGEYICCPRIAGRPTPFVNPDNTTYSSPVCCYGYTPVQPPRACCDDPTDFNTPDDPCCETTTRADGTCCPTDQWIPGAGGAPNTGTCCANDEVFVNNGTVIRCCLEQYADVTGTVCCEPSSGQVLDDQGNCCPTSVINTDPITGQTFCCGPSQRDDFGVCCTSAQTIHTGAVLNGVANASVRICCENNTVDCDGICYWKDPLGSGNIAVPYNTLDANGVCCPNRVDARDCAGLCPDPVTGLPINTYNATFDDCCPESERDCNGVCYGRDKNCCENPTTGADCGTCIAATGCGWCSSPFSSSGACLSGNHFGPYTDPSGLSPCEAGNRWVINPPSEVISKSGTFADGWNMEYKNYTVSLAPNDPLQVNFTVRVPANVPLDLYILQDGTASFGTQVNGQPSSLQNFQSVLPNLLAAIQQNVTSDLTLGFGLFSDKPVEPFGYWSGATFDYLWRNLAPLTTNYASVVAAVNALRNVDLSGGADIPEGQLEALLALGVRFTEVGWRQPTASFSSNHVVLVVTDAPPHKASLGQPFSASGPFDLSYWTDTNAPTSAIGLNNYVRAPPAWVANDLQGTFTPGQCGTRVSSATVTAPYPREGICQDYPSFAQTISALQTQSIAPVFVVAPTNGLQPINVQYPTDIAFSEWTDFVNQYATAEGVPAGQFGLVANLTGVGTAAGAQALEDAILNALYQITQTISLRIISGSEWVTNVSPVEIPSAIPGQQYTFTVTLFWNGTWPGFDGPHPVDVLSLFPKTNFPIEPGHIDIYLSKELFCGYCGDGIVQPEINETCEPGVVPPTPTGVDLPCCSSECQIERNLCNGLARCSPSVCNANGLCQDEPVTCTPIIDAVQSLCSTNSCINGQCVVSCFGANDSNPCCDDGDNCTRDTCVSGVCRHDFELPCDCGGNPAYNSCFACIAVSNTSCGWDLSTGTCVNVNITDLLLHPENYGIDADNVSVVVYEQDVADRRCVAERPPASKVGIIVGVIAGVAALAALIALAAVFGGRIREIAQRIFGSTSASGSAANKVLDNPAYEVAIEQNSALYK